MGVDQRRPRLDAPGERNRRVNPPFLEGTLPEVEQIRAPYLDRKQQEQAERFLQLQPILTAGILPIKIDHILPSGHKRRDDMPSERVEESPQGFQPR